MSCHHHWILLGRRREGEGRIELSCPCVKGNKDALTMSRKMSFNLYVVNNSLSKGHLHCSGINCGYRHKTQVWVAYVCK